MQLTNSSNLETNQIVNGEVHNSPAPILISLAVTVCLGALLFFPLAVIGIPLLVYSIFFWVREEVLLWPNRNEHANHEELGDASWAMIWVIITECIVFSAFFAFWFWARWHTIEWSGAVGGTWPPFGIEHEMKLVTINTILLITSGIFAHFSLSSHLEKKYSKSAKLLFSAIILGLAFLCLQFIEYSTAGFFWSDHPYGTAFFALTGLHGLHVLVGLIAFSVISYLMKSGNYEIKQHDSFRAVVMYWHFVDAVWLLLFIIVYLEVI